MQDVGIDKGHIKSVYTDMSVKLKKYFKKDFS